MHITHTYARTHTRRYVVRDKICVSIRDFFIKYYNIKENNL